ncbi:hypothetical protein LAZ67_4002861 [Cordylochernes scorpioides]|uniref:Transposase n=1 Tax=Cordylochernes scorpioides TaxID=51811 RepID=A0ABY6KDX8_9ARAC|nr:hypothetical protein LAZ67_4002861 [Cordylochernes scorpioides]
MHMYQRRVEQGVVVGGSNHSAVFRYYLGKRGGRRYAISKQEIGALSEGKDFQVWVCFLRKLVGFIYTNNVELLEDLSISFGTCQTIIKNDLHLKRSLAKFVPHLLTNELKEHRKETCRNMVEMFDSDPHWLKNVIMGDETWTKRQSSQWLEPEEPRFKKARMIKSKLKCSEAVRQKRPEKLHQKIWLLHHDNARPHTPVTVQLYLTKHGIALLPQPLYSPELAPNSLKLKKKVSEGRRFDSIPEIKENTKNILKSSKIKIFRGVLISGKKY